MKTKQPKEESEKTTDEDVIEPKTRARKKASDLIEEDKNKASQDDPKPSKETKKSAPKPKAVVKKRPLGIRKTRTLKAKKGIPAKKNAIKKVTTRGRKASAKVETDVAEKQTVPLIPASEIKTEPAEDTTPNSRSQSPKTTGRRSRLSSDIIMMKSVLADAPNNLILGPRTSPYSMRSERSNSPSLFDGKNLRSGKPRKAKNNLLNEVVIKEQKKRRLLSDTKLEAPETPEDTKRLKRGRSCSRDGSEISKCSDVTESDASISETTNDGESKELNKNVDKLKTDVDIDIATNVQISSIGKVPSPSDDPILSENKADTSSITKEKDNKNLSLKTTSLDSENNNSNRLKLENLNVSDLEDRYVLKTENDALFEERSSILTSMSKTFNSKEVSKNIRKARRGKKAAAATRVTSTPIAKNGIPPPIPSELVEDKPETVDSLSKEISDLINDLDQNINQDQQNLNNSTIVPEHPQTRTVSSFYGLSKPLGDNNSIPAPETPVKEKDKLAINNECTPSKNDCENIRLHYEEDSAEKSYENRTEITCAATSIDKLMDRLKEFEEFDKRRQRQESESKSNENKSVMVTNDVVLIHKSGADIKPFKDIQTVKSPERVIEKENVLSCFENNSAISIVKRDQMRRSTDVDLPNSITLIKRNSVSARKESTSSNHSKESDAISIFEKSLGKDVTLTEIKKTMDKPATPAPQVDLNQFATLHPTNTNQTIAMFDTNQISITPRGIENKLSNDVQLTRRKSSLSLTRKSSDSSLDSDKMATIEKIKSPPHQIIFKGIPVTSTPVAIKSPESVQPVEIEALPPLMDIDKPASEDTSLALEAPKVESQLPETSSDETKEEIKEQALPNKEIQKDAEIKEPVEIKDDTKVADKVEEKMEIVDETPKPVENKLDVTPPKDETKTDSRDKKDATDVEGIKEKEAKPEIKPTEKTPGKPVKSKSARNSLEEESPGPSNLLQETPESQKRKENILRTLGLVTHKAANEERIDRQKEKKRLYGNNYPNILKGKSGKSDYTGTLKTVIKLNRGSGDKDKKKYTSSLKLTFQKSKHRGKPPQEVGAQAGVEDAYYTIERREGGPGTSTEDVEAAPEPEPETLNLVIPEKASSFSIHPGRLCMDQCFYCGGKFGLFDTPCHIAQMKSGERQRKVLDNEEKLTIDSCLCDACYRHVDRRANCPSYRKRPLGKPAPTEPGSAAPATHPAPPPKPDSPESEESRGRRAACHTTGCGAPADHSIRRKWLIKMRSSVNSILKLEGDYPGLHTIPLCGDHYRALAPLRACALCRRRLTKHHNLQAPQQNPSDLNGLLQEAQIPAELPEKALLCKWCRCFCSLIQRPTQDKHTRAYRRKLLQIYNVELPPELEQLTDDANILKDCNSGANKQKKKARNKSKQRKSTDNNSESSTKSHSESEKDKKEDAGSDTNNVNDTNTENNTEGATTNNALDETNETTDNTKEPNQPIEEDIESLISSNKIPVPGAMSLENNSQSDSSETDMLSDPDAPTLPLDKQTELRYLLQKQNNPAQFQQMGNLTQKQKNMLKVQTTGIQKSGQQHRINEKNAKRIQKLGQIILQKDKASRKDEAEKVKEMPIMRNVPLNEECTIETIPNKKPADINTLKNKWQMSESFTQVKKNLTELSKKATVENPKKSGDGKYSNPVKRLETNPSISVRELFPGEEEMSLQCNIDFNNVKGVTPEGWEKCNSVIQYDNETKRLWTELQRPYGNQSSFLRHLILLEKYFRSGDLVLSHNATPHAANYSSSVQNRLKAYDNVPQEPPKRDSVSLIEFRKKPSMNGKSLLKSNQTPEDKDPKKFMPPPNLPKPKNKTDKKAKPLPPELIAINTPSAAGRKSINNVLQNIQQLVKDVSASDPTVIAAAPLPANQPKEKKEIPALKYDPPKEKKEMPGLKLDLGKDKKNGPPKPDNKDKKDKKETPKKNESKGWRPTLMPITPENLARIAREPLKTSVDGHSLPSLVQVLSSGIRYHITFEDYNKMALIRKERRKKRFEDKEAKTRKSTDDNTVVTEILSSPMLGNGGTLVQNITPEAEKKETELQMTSNAATILKNVGLKNITIAPITPKTATVTSQTLSPAISSPSLLVTTPIKIPQFGPAVSITSETVLTPNLPIMTTNPMILPKIPKSLTVIPQTMVASQAVMMPVASTAPSQAVMSDRP
ncbi:uncharacterized protein LOC121734764 isoform X2 [Aricia agestis]|uniref:uncharacterized protein LOC121734764 isoform X2 n=1 Tax=Aricia agestis TaxID=91739 RepID=UPI001C207BC5|nr:uncharacterized protein LOC121734764 isoform X2 [Aricia agestis]